MYSKKIRQYFIIKGDMFYEKNICNNFSHFYCARYRNN